MLSAPVLDVLGNQKINCQSPFPEKKKHHFSWCTTKEEHEYIIVH